MNDLIADLTAVHRRYGPGKLDDLQAHTVTLRRTYEAPVEDVWDAITDPDRIARWFLPVSGELRLGGRYQLEGNAGGEILRCDPPRHLAVTWVFGDSDPSEVDVRLEPDADGRTTLELHHVAIVDAQKSETYGPGAVGVGWDLTLLGLAMHLRGDEATLAEKEAWVRSEEARRFMTASASAWGTAHEASGADPEAAATAAKNTLEFYVPPA